MSHVRAFASFFSLLGAVAAQTAEALDEARFTELFEQLTPDEDAPWRRIAWRIDLLGARNEAADRQKPLFVWAMDGHPLGCT